MRFRERAAFTISVAAFLGCGGDRATGPSDSATRAAAALERAAAEVGLGADPTAALTYQSVATALRGGVPVSEVEISVDGGPAQRWYAFGHEIRFEPATGGGPADLFGESSFRTLLAWRETESRVHVIHLVAAGAEGPVGQFAPTEPFDGTEIELPSSLMYSEGRDLFWEAARGTQTNALVSESATTCPGRRRPAGAPAGPTCVLASFSFGFSGVDVEPSGFLFGPNGPLPSAATGTHQLSMGAQPVGGLVMTIDFRTLTPPTVVATSDP